MLHGLPCCFMFWRLGGFSVSLAIITEVRKGTVSSHGTESLSIEHRHRGEEGPAPRGHCGSGRQSLSFPVLASPLCMWQLTVSSPPLRMPNTIAVRGLQFHSQRTWELPENMGAAQEYGSCQSPQPPRVAGTWPWWGHKHR